MWEECEQSSPFFIISDILEISIKKEHNQHQYHNQYTHNENGCWTKHLKISSKHMEYVAIIMWLTFVGSINLLI